MKIDRTKLPTGLKEATEEEIIRGAMRSIFFDKELETDKGSTVFIISIPDELTDRIKKLAKSAAVSEDVMAAKVFLLGRFLLHGAKTFGEAMERALPDSLLDIANRNKGLEELAKEMLTEGGILI